MEMIGSHGFQIETSHGRLRLYKLTYIGGSKIYNVDTLCWIE